MRHNQLVFLIHRDLHVVAHLTPLPRRHLPTIGVRQGYLGLAALLELLDVSLIRLFPLVSASEPLAQFLRRGRRNRGVFRILSVELFQIRLNLGLDLLQQALQLGFTEVAVLTVDRMNLAAVDGHELTAKQPQPLTQHRKLATDLGDPGPIRLPKIGNRLEVRADLSQQPH